MIVQSAIQGIYPTLLGECTDYIFYTDEGEQAGKATLEILENIAWIWNVEIFPEYRGKKLSHRLMQDILGIVHGVDELKLKVFNANKKARKTYLRVGFRTTFKHKYIFRVMTIRLNKEKG